MISVKSAEDAALLANRRLSSRVASLGSTWQAVRAGFRNTLTAPSMIAGVAFVAAIAGARKPRVPESMECKCAKASPSLLRVILVAAVTPLLEIVVAAAWKQFGSAATIADPPDVAPRGEPDLPIPGGFTAP